MMLIDGDKLADTFKDKLCDHLYCWDCSFQLEDGSCKVEKWLDEAPTIEPKQGEWVEQEDCWQCSECGDEFVLEVGVKPIDAKMNFCPNCGARMKGTDDE